MGFSKEHAQNGACSPRPKSKFLIRFVPRFAALCAFEEHAQNGAAVRSANPRVSGPFGGADGALCAFATRWAQTGSLRALCAGLVCSLLTGPAAAQYEPLKPMSDDTIRLARIRSHMSINLTGLPNYTCLQTIERSRRRARSRKFELYDTLRMEVALVSGKELFSWPGSGKFEDRDIHELVGSGTFGNGNFAIHSRSVFLSNAPTFQYDGVREEQGRKLFRYSYDVPQMLSGYRVRSGDKEAIVAYHGYFLADEESLDLVRLEVVTDEIPPALQIATTTSTMHYARVRIGSGEFLLPQSSLLTITDITGGESQNRIEFTGCRQYATESFVSFAEPSTVEPAAAAPPPQHIDVASGLLLELYLQTPVKFSGTAIGDPINALLGNNVRRDGKVVLPKGAVVKGRITGLSKTPGRNGEILNITLLFSEIEFQGGFGSLSAELVEVTPNALAGTRVAVWPRNPEQPGQGTLSLSGNRQELSKGYRMLWRTQTSYSGEKK